MKKYFIESDVLPATSHWPLSIFVEHEEPASHTLLCQKVFGPCRDECSVQCTHGGFLLVFGGYDYSVFTTAVRKNSEGGSAAGVSFQRSMVY